MFRNSKNFTSDRRFFRIQYISGREVLLSNWQTTRDSKFNSRSLLSTQLSRSFLQKSSKYELGSLRKTLTERTPSVGLGPTSGQLALKPTKTITTTFVSHCFSYDHSLDFIKTSILSSPNSFSHLHFHKIFYCVKILDSDLFSIPLSSNASKRLV